MIEHAGGLPHHRSARDDIQVAEVDLLMDLEIVVADVAATDDRDRVVHDEELVVHAVIDAIEVGDEVQQMPRTMGEGIEETDFDVRVRIQGGDDCVTALKVQIIHQDAYPYAAIGGPDQALGQDSAGGVRFPVKVCKSRVFSASSVIAIRAVNARLPSGRIPNPDWPG